MNKQNPPAGLEWGFRYGTAHDDSARQYTDAARKAENDGDADEAYRLKSHAARHNEEAQAWYATVQLICKVA